jgi:decaprenylphospho-beta-D-ribofuranose 2-oxidase
MNKAGVTLAGWGRVQRAACRATRPERFAEAQAAFREPHGARGLCLYAGGRSYGDCALNDGGAALITTRLDRVLRFDEATGLIEVEPGVTFQRLLAAFLPRGFLAPVTPGTGFATIGGAVANDVHGKNHERDGSFGQHVTEIDLLCPDGTARTVTPADTTLFRATLGGLGLTGFITRIAFRMKRVPGAWVQVREQRIGDLDRFLDAMAERADAPYCVGWIDATSRGAALGRGILEVAAPLASDFAAPPSRRRAVPVDFPGFALNPLTVAAFNAVYWRRVPAEGRTRPVHLGRFLYPLDAIQGWNRIYGRRGFYQFQCVVPYETGPAALRDLLETIATSRQASFLAVLKRLGAGRAGYLSFPMPGYTLALDFPRKPGIEEFYARLCAVTLRAGGRVYLAKDALLTGPMLRAMYPEFASFQQVLAEIDPQRRLQSDMARRLALQDPP